MPPVYCRECQRELPGYWSMDGLCHRCHPEGPQ